MEIFSRGWITSIFPPNHLYFFILLSSPSLPVIAVVTVMRKNFPSADANLAGAQAGHLHGQLKWDDVDSLGDLCFQADIGSP